MALSKCSGCPVMSRYHHYLESPIMWSRYRLSDPYWTRYHHEFERTRMSMMVQQDLIDEMLNQVQASRAMRRESTAHINTCAAKCASISRSLEADSRSIASIESEMAGWQRAVSDMHSTMSGLKSRTESMGSTIEALKGDLAKCSRTLQTEFNIEALLSEMEGKRKKAEMECNRIYSTLQISKPRIVESESWCPICKSNTCVYSTKVEEPIRAPTPPPPANVCGICGSENCTYGKSPLVLETAEPSCPVCGSANCTYGKQPVITTVTTATTTVASNVCSVCGAENCQYGKGTRCKVCNSLTCQYKSDSSDNTTKYLVIVDDEPITSSFVATTVCEICGAENCTYGATATTKKMCDICFKEDCPYFVGGSF